jgi:hypothetical protein
MESQSVLESQLAKIEARLSSGIESVSSDGTSTKVNLAALRKQRDDLRRKLKSQKMKRPVASRIDLGGF